MKHLNSGEWNASIWDIGFEIRLVGEQPGPFDHFIKETCSFLKQVVLSGNGLQKPIAEVWTVKALHI